MVQQVSQDLESGLEHRQSARYRLSIPAVVFHEGMQLFYAEIEDFCQNGLFLVARDQNIPAHIEQGSAITIQFSTGETNGASTCSLDAEIARISKDGIGVHLLKSSPKVIDVLTKLSKQQCSSVQSETEENALVDKRKTSQLVVELIIPKLPALAEQCLDECYELISNRMLSPESNHYANRYFEALSELKTKKSTIIDEFLNAQQRAFTNDEGSKAEHSNQSDQFAAESELSLVDEVEFEDWLAIQEMSKRIERRHEELLAQLSNQLSRLMTIDNPQQDLVIAPLVLCASFNEALCTLGFDGSMRVLIYPGLEEGLQLYLGQFYQQLSADLTEDGYPPANQKARVPGLPRRAVQAGIASGVETDIYPQAESVDTASGVANIQSTVNDQGSTDSQQPQQSLVENHVSELNSLAQVLQSMHSMSPIFNQGSQIIPAQPSAVAGNADQVRELINNMVPSDTNNEALLALQDQIIQALIGRQGHHHVIDQQKSTSLAANTQIFDALRNQVNSQSPTQSYIQQLQLPFLHHALSKQNDDQSTDDVTQHIINLLDQINNLIGDSNKTWAVEAKKHIEGLVQRVVSESATRPEVLTDVEAELVEYSNKALLERDRREEKLIESCEGQQRFRKAKRDVNQLLQEHFAGKTVPVIIPRLLKTGWKQLLVRTELRDGLDSEQWQQMFGVIERLKDWLLDADNLQSVAEDEIQELLTLVDGQLSHIGLDAGKQKNIMGELVALLLGSGTPRIVQSAKLMKIKAIAAEKEETNTTQSKCRWVDNLQVGDWCEFIVGKQRVETLKLVWLGNNPWQSVFVNQSGIKRLEFSRDELIKHYHAKMVSKTESPDQPIATRAKHAVVEKFYMDVRHNSLEDTSVGLPNGKGLMAYLRETDFQTATTLVYVEIDDHRIINQACGMEASDDLVKDIAERMQQHAAKNAMLARIDDQSLAMVLTDTKVDSFYRMAPGWSEELRTEPFKYENQSFPIALSIGLIGFTEETLQVDKVIKHVAVACAGAKQAGRNQIKVYSDDDWQLQQRAEQLEWAGHIDQTLAENRLVLACQLIVPVGGNATSQQVARGDHYEVLLRVLDAKGRISPPASFLSAGEQLRRMPDIDRWVVTNLLQWMQDNLELVEKLDGFSVNLSGQSVASQSFLQFVTEQVIEANFDPSKLTFEITETVAIDDFDYVKKFIQHMRKLGCKFSLDDFGSGYASYSYLRNLDVDYLKIDGLFVKEMHVDSKDLMMVKSMNNIAHSLGLKTIAEFVENQEILDLLGEIGVDYAQGYHLGKPTPMAELFKTDETSEQSKISA
jgi:diguanylate cyclase (GGDEF)-like protein